MYIVYIHQHFTTLAGSSGTRSYDVSRNLVKMGHNVTMICGVADISGLEKLPWYCLFRKVCMEGFDVIICNVWYSNYQKPMRRKLSFCWFAFLATLAALTVRKPDLIFASSTPLTVGIPGYLAAKLKHAAFVFEVRDMWPESFIRGGFVTGDELYIKILVWLERFIYKHAVKILLVSHGFERRLIERGFPAEKMRAILLGADGDTFRDVKSDHEFLDRYKLHNKTLAVYTGAHGKTNGLSYILDAAEHSKDRSDIAYVLIGNGQEKPQLIKAARNRRLENVVFVDSVSKKELAGILAVCHIGLVIFKNIGEDRPLTPNKLFDYMFTGIPVIVNYTGATINMVRANDCGLYVDSTQPKDLADKVKMLADNTQLCAELGRRGQKVAWERYDLKIIAQQLAEVFKEAIELYHKK